MEERKLDPKVEVILEARGLGTVRMNLQTAGVAFDAQDAQGGRQISINRADAEFWVQRKEAAAARRDTVRFWATVIILGTAAAIIAAVEGD
jgi:hypothetical protein